MPQMIPILEDIINTSKVSARISCPIHSECSIMTLQYCRMFRRRPRSYSLTGQLAFWTASRDFSRWHELERGVDGTFCIRLPEVKHAGVVGGRGWLKVDVRTDMMSFHLLPYFQRNKMHVLLTIY